MIAAAVLASTGSDGDPGAFGLVFFLSGFVFFFVIFARYRNADKRYRHEKQTRTVTKNIEVRDDFVRSRKGLSNRTMDGANHDSVSGSLNPTARSVHGLMREINRYRHLG
ncbi:hypothetical protein [Isoptericola sp. AK164]|uniref:hypothetical protein n=1 Tax=Isoptericola sp. AK164 TaxID=3024246 RepID=UPI0024183FCC|nr:hypothetical protein [Isoptericola sp. AK164]